MEKHTGRDILFEKWKNGETVILTFVSPLFCYPLKWWGPIPLLVSISCCIHRLSSGRWSVDSLIVLRAAPTNFNSISPHWFQSIQFFITFLPPSQTPGEFSPFFNLLILSIARFSYTGDILYYLCATVTFTTFTSAIWSPHGNFTKVYFYTPVEFVLGSHKKLGLKHEFVTR